MGKKSRKMRSPKFVLKANALRANLSRNNANDVAQLVIEAPAQCSIPVQEEIHEQAPAMTATETAEEAPVVVRPKTSRKRKINKPKAKEPPSETVNRNFNDILSDSDIEV